GDVAANASMFVDRHESDPFRQEIPTLAIVATCCPARHRDADAIGGELVGDRLSKAFGPSMHFHFNRCHARSARADNVRSPTENRDLDSDVESGMSKPSRDRFTKVGLKTKFHNP